MTVGKVEEGQSDESSEPKPDSPPVISEKRKERAPSSEFLSQEDVLVNLEDSKIEELIDDSKIEDQDLPTSTQPQQTGSEPPVLARYALIQMFLRVFKIFFRRRGGGKVATVKI